MTSAHDKILFQFLKAVSRIFDLCIPKTAGYGPNPKNIDDTLEIDIISQKGSTAYVFEVEKDKNEIPAAITQLKDRYAGLFLNRDNIVNKKKQLPHYDYIKLFIVTPKNVQEINEKGSLLNQWQMDKVLKTPEIIQ